MTGIPHPPCVVCGDPRVHGRGRCGTCYRFLWRHGTDRPFDLVIRQTERDIERALEQDLRRRATRRYS